MVTDLWQDLRYGACLGIPHRIHMHQVETGSGREYDVILRWQ
jgi:hypothetical protein